MADLEVVYTRGPMVESTHQVSVAVVAADGRLVGRAGDPDFITFWRSAAKPFQLLPLIHDGGIGHFHLDREMLALACASHNAEPVHRAVGERWLKALGATEADLACGGHPSLWPALAREMIHDDIAPTPLWSNCSGNHAAMLALARLHGWPEADYAAFPHPVQQRVLESISQWTALDPEKLRWGIDGCTAASVALPLRAMARAYGALGVSSDPGATAVREAMMAEPYLVAGADRLDTTLMEAWPGRVLAKIGAEGVYSAALPTLGLGIALKVHDGDMTAACQALVAVIEATVAKYGAAETWPLEPLDRWRTTPITSTRGTTTGYIEVDGGLRWL
jgi:L-asparaginase II